VIIVGGVYREECVVPRWSRIFGSGGRAAVAVAALGGSSTLYAYACETWAEDARLSFAATGVDARLTEIAADIGFHYFHPMSRAEQFGSDEPAKAALNVRGKAILRFGFVEGDAIIHAERCVFDPQNADQALQFRDNGSRADALAVVLNETELHESTRLVGAAAVAALREKCRAEIVIVKRGPRGAHVYAGDGVHAVSARLSPEVFKIGSGDVFSAVFAEHWANRRTDPVSAAEAASLAVSQYVTTRDVASLASAGDGYPPAPANGPGGPIYIAAPFFNLGQRWVVEEVRNAIAALGASTFSPLHDVGTGGGAAEIAAADLNGLRSCRSMIAIVDGEDAGTLFEIGYARDRGIPVVVLSENPRPEAMTMLEGSGCRITHDLASAVYHAVWAALE
jgi:sugar/nucleoside kinase (ribokinase family)